MNVAFVINTRDGYFNNYFNLLVKYFVFKITTIFSGV